MRSAGAPKPALRAPGAPISSSVWSIDPSDALVSLAQNVDNTNKRSLIKLGGGVVGTTYTVTCRMTDSAGEKYERAVKISAIETQPH